MRKIIYLDNIVQLDVLEYNIEEGYILKYKREGNKIKVINDQIAIEKVRGVVSIELEI